MPSSKAIPTKTQLRNGAWITIHVEPAQRGKQRRILIDGVEWGTAHITLRGVHGYYLSFRDVAARMVYQPADPEKGRKYPGEWKVWSDKYAKRNNKDERPIEVRLISEIKAMIETLALDHPDKVRRDVQRKRDDFRKRQEDAANLARAELVARAKECLNQLGLSASTPGNLEAIVSAMQWAQAR